MTPAECDLRGLEWMPLYGHRLFGSTLWGTCSDAGFRAALRLWWVAFQQCPAASLPNDDVALCRLAELGRDAKAWAKVRAEALHGFVLCSDGRLYHPVVAGLAMDAWARRLTERKRKASWRNRKDVPRDKTGTGRGQDAGQDGDGTGTETGTERGRNADVPADRTGQDRTKEESSSLRSGDVPSPALFADLPDDRPKPIRALVYSDGLPIIRQLTGQSEAQARTLIGRLLRECQDDCARLHAALREAHDLQPADPVAWLFGAVRRRGGAPADRTAWVREEMAREVAQSREANGKQHRPAPVVI